MSVQLSVYLFSCLSICPDVCLSVQLSVYLSSCLSICPAVCLSVQLSVYLPSCLSICRAVCLSAQLSVYLSSCLSICRDVCLYAQLSVYMPSCLALKKIMTISNSNYFRTKEKKMAMTTEDTETTPHHLLFQAFQNLFLEIHLNLLWRFLHHEQNHQKPRFHDQPSLRVKLFMNNFSTLDYFLPRITKLSRIGLIFAKNDNSILFKSLKKKRTSP